MTGRDLCALLFGPVPVTSAGVARIAKVAVEDIDAFYQAVQQTGLVDRDERTRIWFPTANVSCERFLRQAQGLGISISTRIGGGLTTNT